MDMMTNFWDDRYAEKDFAYGTLPNTFFAEQIEHLQPGKILLPCEGEGRNAVYAAKKGWEVEAFDSSIEGMKKALALAEENNVKFNYTIADAMDIEFPFGTFDIVALIYTHLPAEIRRSLHRKVTDWLKPGGLLILEAFSPLQISNTSGGPKDPDMLYSMETIEVDFKQLKLLLLQATKIILNEGKYHQGHADVIRFIGSKEN